MQQLHRRRGRMAQPVKAPFLLALLCSFPSGNVVFPAAHRVTASTWASSAEWLVHGCMGVDEETTPPIGRQDKVTVIDWQ